MNTHALTLAGAALEARASGALYWPEHRCLVVSDLHLCKSARVARRQGVMLPPYETTDTLARLAGEIAATDPALVICLGDSFDDLAAAEEISQADRDALMALQAGRRWVWIEGNHDPGPVDIGGDHRADLVLGPLTFRHIARTGAEAEVSGHYHPKAALAARGRSLTRPAFLSDGARLIMPAFGTYTGGLSATSATLRRVLGPKVTAILTGRRVFAFPLALEPTS